MYNNYNLQMTITNIKKITTFQLKITIIYIGCYLLRFFCNFLPDSAIFIYGLYFILINISSIPIICVCTVHLYSLNKQWISLDVHENDKERCYKILISFALPFILIIINVIFVICTCFIAIDMIGAA